MKFNLFSAFKRNKSTESVNTPADVTPTPIPPQSPVVYPAPETSTNVNPQPSIVPENVVVTPEVAFTAAPTQPVATSFKPTAEIAPQPITTPEYTNSVSVESVATPYQVASPASDVIADVVSQPTGTTPENNSPSSPTPTI
jgi:hypothetical protein